LNVSEPGLLSFRGMSFGLEAVARSDSLARMIELEVYACGLRDGDNVLQLQSQMDMMPRIRYKVDVRHDLVYFEIDNPAEVTQRSITKMFEAIGLEARFVGQIPPEIELGSDTIRLV